VDQGTSVTFDGSASTDNFGIAAYSWAFTDSGNTVVLTGVTPTHYFAESGVYTVNLRVTDLTGNTHDDIMTVTVRDTVPPVARAADGITVDQGFTATLDGSASTDNVGITQWVWTFEYDGTMQRVEQETFDWTFEFAGEVDVTLTVHDAAGNVDTHSIMLSIRDTEDPVAEAGPDRTVNMNDTVNLDTTGSTDNLGIVTYSWSFHDGKRNTDLEGSTVSHVFPRAGTYVIQLTVTDRSLNTNVDTFTLIVRDTQPPTLGDIPDVNATVGIEETFVNPRAYDNVDVVQWTWSFREGGQTVRLNGARVTHTFTEAGTYRVTLTVEDASGNVASTSFDVHVEASNAGSTGSILAVVILVVIGVIALIIILERRTPKE